MPDDCTRMAVVQGKDYVDAWKSFRGLKELGYKKIAISYGATWYNDLFPHVNKDLGKALGRLTFIGKLIQEGELSKYDRIHLLGCAVPQEFGWYRDLKFIESIDTSNPIIHGLQGVQYNSLGLLTKSSTKIDQIEEEITTERLYDINHNLIRFKKFIEDSNTQLY